MNDHDKAMKILGYCLIGFFAACLLMFVLRSCGTTTWRGSSDAPEPLYAPWM